MIINTKNVIIKDEICFIKAKKNIYHPSANIPFMKGKTYEFRMEAYNSNISISSNSARAMISQADTAENRVNFAKFVNANFVKTEKPIFNIATVVDPKDYKFHIVNGAIVETIFDTVLYTPKIGSGRFDNDVYYDDYCIVLGVLKTPMLKNTIKESEYTLKTKIDVLKELYGDFEVLEPNQYVLKQDGFCTNGWFIKNGSINRHRFTEIFYYNGIKYLTNTDCVPDLLADAESVSNCFKTKQEAINQLLK